MPEIEVPTEHLHEALHEHAHGHGHGGGGDGQMSNAWKSGVALTAAILAVMAAVAALFAGHHANEALIDQVKASNQWNYYQAKGIKKYLFENKSDILAGMGRPKPEGDLKKIATYDAEQKTIQADARKHEHHSEHHLQQHNILARSVTLFQVAIALAAITVLIGRKPLWFVSVAFGLGGSFFLVQGFLA